MVNVMRTNVSRVEIPAYLVVKHSSLRAGLFSCSQQGFNIAMGPLLKLRRAVSSRLSGLDPQAVGWEVPPLIRADWVESGIWRDPADEQWCTEQPAGHVLTPRPVLHLVNRLRHHPVDHGTWLLSGACVRNEDPQETLPLLRQRAFTMLEYVRIAGVNDESEWRAGILNALWDLLIDLDLPVGMVELPADGQHGSGGTAILLHLPEVPPVSLARAWRLPTELLAAYQLDGRYMDVVGCGVERLCLGILSRWGLEAKLWPIVDS